MGESGTEAGCAVGVQTDVQGQGTSWTDQMDVPGGNGDIGNCDGSNTGVMAMLSGREAEDFSGMLDLVNFDFNELDQGQMHYGGNDSRDIAREDTSDVNMEVPSSEMGALQNADDFGTLFLQQGQGIDFGLGLTDPSLGVTMMQQTQQKQPQQQKQSQKTFGDRLNHYQRPGVVPPTPVSLDLRPGHSPAQMHTPTAIDGGRHHEYTIPRDDLSAFTPLMSPMMTPLEQTLRMPDYAMPGEYFSPLTSPALEAQNGSYSIQSDNAKGMMVSAPMDVNVRLSAASTGASPSSPAYVRRSRRASQQTATRTGRIVRNSPLVHARRKSTQTRRESATLTSTDLPAAHYDIVQAQNNNNTEDSSGQDSVSPESLSEPLMPPPVLPRSSILSPHGSMAQDNGNYRQNLPQLAAAVTPSTLMKMPRQLQNVDGGRSDAHSSRTEHMILGETLDETMEDIALPEAAASAPFTLAGSENWVVSKQQQQQNQQEEQHGQQQQSSQQMPPPPGLPQSASSNSTGTPQLRPSQPGQGTTGSRSRAGSFTPSPNILPRQPQSQYNAISPTVDRTKSIDNDNGNSGRARANKKRSSTGNNGGGGRSHPSPALRPRISPNIQPLLRASEQASSNSGGGSGGSGEQGGGGGLSTSAAAALLSAESSALYLASKSNYQHIIDGTVLPGVSYPETLAENLSSKRTNHKLAEQGRRNRINAALKEVEALLPDPLLNAGRERERDGVGGSGAGGKEKAPAAISKASTVEMAIVYIKALQAELVQTKSKLEEMEGRCRCSSRPRGVIPDGGKGSNEDDTNEGVDQALEECANERAKEDPGKEGTKEDCRGLEC